MMIENNKRRTNRSNIAGTPAGFYYALPVVNSSKFVIWFGDGDICGTVQQCFTEYLNNTIDTVGLCNLTDPRDEVTRSVFTDGENNVLGSCYAVHLQHTSSWYSPNFTTIRAETLLCGTDPHFQDYNRIYLPSCTLDWWLGNGDDDPSHNNSLWRGSRVIDALFSILSAPPYNIQSASRVVLGGSGGGGIGVINNFVRLRTGVLNSIVNVMAVVDSAFLVNVQRFANLSSVFMGTGEVAFQLDSNIRNRVAGWLGSAKIDAQCRAYWGAGESSRCTYLTQVLNQPTMQNQRVMVIQSQYDLAELAQLDLFNISLSNYFVDNASYAENAMMYMEGFGSEVRRNIESSSYFQGGADNQYFFSTACGTYGYIVPTEQQVVTPQKLDLGEAGQLEFRRDNVVWTQTQVKGLSLRDAIVGWVSSQGLVRPVAANSTISQIDRNGVRTDLCASFLCNPTCAEVVIHFRLSAIWGPCSQTVVIAYCLIMLGSFWFVFLIAASAVCCFRRKTKRYWDEVGHTENMETSRDPNVESRYRDQAEEELIRDAFASARRVHLMVRNLNYWAPPRKSGRAYQILRTVSATFPAGKVHAIMGPSGSGKTTLLDIIALTRDTGIITGSHYVNGVDSYSSRAKFLREWLRHNVSYVRQKDYMFPRLTVREHLTHAAWLMLPEFMDTDAKLRRVWQVIKLMGLEHSADIICGDGGVEIEGGISGGQRRRVSVATQLLKLPACLVLDEPTSGLDATNALALVKSLHTLAHRAGTNVIMTIHQPRREIFRFLDTLKILVGGRMLFAGMPKEAFDHFEVSRQLNLGDEVLDQLGKAQLDVVLAYQRKYEKGPLGKRVEQEMISEVVVEFDAGLAAELEYTLITNALADGRWSWTESSSAPLLMYVLLSRTIRRGGFDIHKTATISLIGGVLVGIVFYGGVDSFQRHLSVTYLSVAAMSCLQGTFIGDRYWAERFMYTFESEAGTARPWISFLASMFCRLIVASTVESLTFAVPLFFLGRMNDDDNQVRLYLVILVMCAVSTAAQYLMVEVYFMRPDDKRTGALVNIALLSMSALFNGFIIELQDLPVYLRWVPYLMVSYWAFAGVLINDLAGFELFCDASVLECSTQTGDAIVKGLNFDNRDLYQCLFALLILVGVFLIGSVLIFFFKWVHHPLGEGMKRRTNQEINEEDRLFIQQAKDLVREEGVATNTMQSVLNDGKQLVHKQGSAKQQLLIRANSSDGMIRNNSATGLTRNDSFGSPETTARKMVLNPVPVEMEPENSSKTLGSTDSKPPPLENQSSLHLDGDDVLPIRESCCHHDRFFVRPFLSRIFLVCYFIVDFLASTTICNGEEDSFSGNVLQNTTQILGDIGSINSNSVNVIFVLVTAIFFIGYLIQYLIQFVFLLPRDGNNQLNPCTRVGVLDLLGAVFVGLDLVLLLILIGAGKDAQVQIYLLIAIRICRGLRVMTFWYKISAFHELRAVAYLEYKLLLMKDYDPAVFGENTGNDIGDKESDVKPFVNSETKPKIDLKLLHSATLVVTSLQSEKNDDTSFFRRAIQSIRASNLSVEQKRVSLQKPLSQINKRISSRSPPPPSSVALASAGLLDAPAQPRPIPPPVPPVPPRPPPVLPSMMRVNFPGGGSAHASIRLPGFPGGSQPRVANAATSLGPPPPIPPRTGASLAAFGITPGTLQLMQAQRPQHHAPGFRSRRDEPTMDEI